MTGGRPRGEEEEDERTSEHPPAMKLKKTKMQKMLDVEEVDDEAEVGESRKVDVEKEPKREKTQRGQEGEKFLFGQVWPVWLVMLSNPWPARDAEAAKETKKRKQ
ncbi:hypothetical protein H112_02551, partial [Trichophyton rubrum D6]